MDVDIRVPIGLLFAILGALLLGYGLLTYDNVEIYTRSLGHNANLWTGILMLLFGLIMLFFTKKKKSNT